MSRGAGASAPDERVALRTLAREWGRIGVIGVGGPPAHIALLRRLSVEDRHWLTDEDFAHALAAANLLPGPASTQLMIYVAWRLRGVRGALVGATCFIAPGLLMIVSLAAVFFVRHPAHWLLGASLGAGAAVPAVAVRTAWQLAVPSWRATTARPARNRWILYVLVGVVTSLLAPALVVLALVVCGVSEVLARRPSSSSPSVLGAGTVLSAHVATLGGVGALAWVALKVGALSYGGGFVIVPLMQHDVVSTYHWMTGAQFLNVVALGQITPGPVVLTVAAVGYAAHGLSGAALATLVAFAPSLVVVIAGARHFERLRRNRSATAFLAGAGPAVTGAIAASSIALGLLVTHQWQLGVLAGALGWTFVLRRSATVMLLIAALLGALLSGVVPV